MKYICSAALAASISLASGSAFAATVTFNTAGPNIDSLAFSQGGVSGTVTPSSDTVLLVDSEITQSTDGLGVFTDRIVFDDTDPDVDNQGGDERLTFTFDAPVSLVDVLFSDLDDDDDVTIFVNGSFFGTADDASNPFAFGGIMASSFAIEASCGFIDCILGADDSFRVLAFTANPAPIPLPASGLLLGAGAAGLAVLRRRKST